MKLKFQPITLADADQLAEWLSSQVWHFHGQTQLSPEHVKKQFEKGFYTGDEVQSFWIKTEADHIAGFLRVFDLDDLTPLFDLRIDAAFRGKNIGTHALEWLTRYVFETFENVRRIEGYTRQDNRAMRRVFEKCGYVKEAHHRRAWKSDDHFYDAVGYGILREDWQTGNITPIHWAD